MISAAEWSVWLNKTGKLSHHFLRNRYTHSRCIRMSWTRVKIIMVEKYSSYCKMQRIRPKLLDHEGEYILRLSRTLLLLQIQEPRFQRKGLCRYKTHTLVPSETRTPRTNPIRYFIAAISCNDPSTNTNLSRKKKLSDRLKWLIPVRISNTYQH